MCPVECDKYRRNRLGDLGIRRSCARKSREAFLVGHLRKGAKLKQRNTQELDARHEDNNDVSKSLLGVIPSFSD